MDKQTDRPLAVGVQRQDWLLVCNWNPDEEGGHRAATWCAIDGMGKLVTFNEQLAREVAKHPPQGSLDVGNVLAVLVCELLDRERSGRPEHDTLEQMLGTAAALRRQVAELQDQADRDRRAIDSEVRAHREARTALERSERMRTRAEETAQATIEANQRLLSEREDLRRLATNLEGQLTAELTAHTATRDQLAQLRGRLDTIASLGMRTTAMVNTGQLLVRQLRPDGMPYPESAPGNLTQALRLACIESQEHLEGGAR